MIISCPLCSKQYNVDDHLFEGTSRKVRCVDCYHVWLHSSMEPVVASDEDSLKPEDDPLLSSVPAHAVAEITHLSKEPIPGEEPDDGIVKRYKIDWILLIVSLIILVLIFFTESDYIIRQLPPKTQIFHKEAVVPVNPEKDLVIQYIKYDLKQSDDQSQVVVRGEIFNPTPQILSIPNLVISVTGSASKDLDPTYSTRPTKNLFWGHPVSVDKILPGEHVTFESRLTNSPLQLIDKINVNFGNVNFG